MKNLILISVLFLCLTACEKGNKNPDLYYRDNLLSQISLGTSAVHGLTYNSDYLIYESLEPFRYKKYYYDNFKKLAKVEIALSFNPLSCLVTPGMSLEEDPRRAKISEYIEFEYDSDSKLIKRSHYFPNEGHPKLIAFETYEYENDKIVKTSTFNPESQATQYIDYEYDENDNVTREFVYKCGTEVVLLRTVEYEFDIKNNPYLVFSSIGEPGKYSNRNNITKETQLDYHGTNVYNRTISHTYEYNSLDYPVKIDKLDCKYGK